MARKGGKRGKPHALKLLQGEIRPQRLNPNEPKPDKLENIDPPDYLTPEAKKYWNYYCPFLIKMGVMTVIDVKQLEIFCNACADEVRYRQLLKDEGEIVKTIKEYDGKPVITGTKLHPAVRLLKIASDAIDKYGVALALNPQDRSRMSIEPPGEDKPKGIAAYIK